MRWMAREQASIIIPRRANTKPIFAVEETMRMGVGRVSKLD